MKNLKFYLKCITIDILIMIIGFIIMVAIDAEFITAFLLFIFTVFILLTINILLYKRKFLESTIEKNNKDGYIKNSHLSNNENIRKIKDSNPQIVKHKLKVNNSEFKNNSSKTKINVIQPKKSIDIIKNTGIEYPKTNTLDINHKSEKIIDNETKDSILRNISSRTETNLDQPIQSKDNNKDSNIEHQKKNFIEIDKKSDKNNKRKIKDLNLNDNIISQKNHSFNETNKRTSKKKNEIIEANTNTEDDNLRISIIDTDKYEMMSPSKSDSNIYINETSSHNLHNFIYTKARTLSDSFVVLDFETTGLKYDEHKIIQYAVIEYKKGNIINETMQYINPGVEISKRITKLTGITNEMVKDKPFIEEELERINDLIRGKTIVAHNASFDMKFLLYQFNKNNIKYDKFRVIDTLKFARNYIHETPNHKLKTLKDYFNLDDGKSHNSLNDCRATGRLALLLYERSKK